METMDRREFLRFGGQGLGYAALARILAGCGGGEGDGAAPDVGETDALPAASAESQWLKRTSFGITPESLADIQSLGINVYFEQQLSPGALDDLAVETQVALRFPLANAGPTVLRAGYPDNQTTIVQHVEAATYFRAYFSPRQLHEVMVEFWHTHFSVQILNGVAPIFHPSYDVDVIRPNALGRFGDLLHAVAKSPAMVYYLDNFLNFVGSPQENYARELMELHTLGVDGGYTELDVKELASCFTGWTINSNTARFQFVAALHDDGAKTVLGHSIPAGGGIGDGEQVLEILAAHPATARFIATKLCRRFVTDHPSQSLIDDIAAVYVSTDGDIPAMLRALFAAPDFAEVRDAKFLRPTEFIGQMLRAMNAPNAFPSGDRWSVYFYLLQMLGQVPFYWVAPNGYPDVAAYWATTSGLLNRWRIALVPGIPDFQDLFDLSRLSAGAGTIAELVDAVAANLLFRSLADEDRQGLIDYLSAQAGVEADTPLGAEVLRALSAVSAALLISSAYFQLR